MSWMQTLNGTKWDLLSPDPAALDWREIATTLAALPRFNAHTFIPYTVAEHCCRVHDHLIMTTNMRDTLHVGLLHDAHESFVGDITTPVVEALAAIAGQKLIREALSDLKDRQDEVIFSAAELALPLAPRVISAVKEADLKLLMTERRDLCAPPPAPWAGGLEFIEPLQDRITPWHRDAAAAEWLTRLSRYISIG